MKVIYMSIETRIEDNIVIVTLNDGKTNSVSTEVLKTFDQVVEQVNNDPELKGIILTGTGRFFSSGFYLPTFYSFESEKDILDWFLYEEEVLLKWFTCSKPVVAAINGHCAAAGMIFSMASDYRIAVNNPKIKMGMTEIKIGLALTPAECEVMRWGLDTIRNYKDIIFKGEMINVAKAIELGIFDGTVDDAADLIPQAKAQISALIDTPGRPFIELKRMHKLQAAKDIRNGIDNADFQPLITTFTSDAVKNTLKAVHAAMG